MLRTGCMRSEKDVDAIGTHRCLHVPLERIPRSLHLSNRSLIAVSIAPEFLLSGKGDPAEVAHDSHEKRNQCLGADIGQTEYPGPLVVGLFREPQDLRDWRVIFEIGMHGLAERGYAVIGGGFDAPGDGAHVAFERGAVAVIGGILEKQMERTAVA